MDLNIWKPVEGQLFTSWSKDIDPSCPLPEYPRPQLQRENWLNLNGLWDYAIRSKKVTKVIKYDGKILVPFPIESALSGVKKKLKPSQRLFYRRSFKIPNNWNKKRILINFGAVDWETTVKINQKKLNTNRGGFVPFSYDITEYIDYSNENSIEVIVWDPSDKGMQEKGKQSLRPMLVFYTAVSGIWQTVWLEPVSKSHIKSINIIPDIDQKKITLKTNISNVKSDQKLQVTIFDQEEEILTAEGNNHLELIIPEIKLWSPNTPFLYTIHINLQENGKVVDNIISYFGMRKIAVVTDKNGIPRIRLNNKEIFQLGPLDQGYWPDGLYTAPSDEALKYDIEIIKDLGFNMIRKHVKIEPARWYYWCDKLGLLVWQDIPNGGKFSYFTFKFFSRGRRNSDVREQYKGELSRMIDSLYNFPSIIVWIPFNEGWGQFETKNIVSLIRNKDTSRLIDAASGWFDKNVGDILDIHKYPGPGLKMDGVRASVLGEFGGLGLKIDKHTWAGKRFYWSINRSKSKSELEMKYKELMKTLKPLINQGLTAAVYTQTTDIEGEINGYLTYDRKILKLNKDLLRSIHEKLLL